MIVAEVTPVHAACRAESHWVSFVCVPLASECWLGWFLGSVVRRLDLELKRPRFDAAPV